MDNNILSQSPQNQESNPLQEAHRAIDKQIDKLLAFKAQLIRAQLAGLTTVPMENPDTGEIYQVAIDLAIEAVIFASEVKKGGE